MSEDEAYGQPNAAEAEQIREATRDLLRDFRGAAFVAQLTDEQLPTARYFGNVTHGDLLTSGRAGDWFVICGEGSLVDVAVRVNGSAPRVVVEQDLVLSTLHVGGSGCEVFVRGRVQDSEITAGGGRIHLLGGVGGHSMIRAARYTTAYELGSAVSTQGWQEDLPDHLRQLAPPSPPAYVPLANLPARQRPRPSWPATASRFFRGPDPVTSDSHQLRLRRSRLRRR